MTRETETATQARTTTQTVALDEPVPAWLAEEMGRRIYFVDERIVGFDLLDGHDEVHGVRLVTDRPTAAGELARKVNAMVSAEVLPQLSPQPSVRWRSARRDADHVRPAYADMLARGLAFPCGDGQVAIAEPVLALFHRLDDLVTGIVRTEFGAREYRYPTLLPLESLRRSGYVTSFPHHVMFATRLPADLDEYRGFVADVEAGTDAGQAAMARCTDGTYCLPPTMCYHTFQQLRGTRLADERPVVTARGKSFRFESRYETDLERLWDFTIRETVFFGPRDHVRAELERFLGLVTALFDELGLTGQVEAANDPFFASGRAAESASSQRLLQLKYEARLAVAPDRTIAVSSFNLHDAHFGSAFDIALPDGSTAHSACVGFGLERLTYAVLCQFGLDQRQWPRQLRSTD
jgi:seryl-tRNA synthetase